MQADHNDGKRAAQPGDSSAKRARSASTILSYGWHDLGGATSQASTSMRENELVFATDWASTELGPIHMWPSEVLSHVWTNVLNSKFVSAVFLGPELRLVYNKAYADMIEGKHPMAMGQPLFRVYPEVETLLRPLYTRILEQRDCVSLHNQAAPLVRSMIALDSIVTSLKRLNGYLEEHYFDINYSSVVTKVELHTTAGNSRANTVGVHVTMIETTRHVIAQRRLTVLSELSQTDATNSPKDIAKRSLNIIARNKMDFPACAIYLVNKRGLLALELSVGIDACEFSLPGEGNAVNGDLSDKLAHQIYASVKARKVQTFDHLVDSSGRIFAAQVDGNVSKRMHIIPLVSASKDEVHGILLVCHNPLASPTNADYLSFLASAANSISDSIGISKTLTEGVQRAEEQRRLSESKTTFFHNISHEFRTPLTLMLGPLEDLLEVNSDGNISASGIQLGFVYRNACRLLRLVNQLLDFSRIEAGRQKASFLSVDLALLTADLASVFRAACANANLEFVVQCHSLAQPVYVDTEMWEKIVLNLLSNAYKFTKRGRILVEQSNSSDGNDVVLRVCDTGCGIPQSELPRMFERFHQVKSAESRSHEGTGIGLALVSELVKLHGGKIGVESTVNLGTIISISIPYGRDHLPAADVIETNGAALDPAKARTKVQQLKSAWLLEQDSPAASGEPELENGLCRGEVLVADDNPDMLLYVSRILRSSGYKVVTARDGQEALELVNLDTAGAIDLVLSDVMMPRLDGFGLLRALHANQATRHLPIIFLSARAGDEAKVEGIEAGADDYLVKPFTAKELIARVNGKVYTRRLQLRVGAQQQQLRKVAEEMNAAKDRFLAVLSHELRTPLTPALLLAEEMHMDLTNSVQLRENCGTILRNILLEVQLIDDLLDIAKIAQQKLRIQLKPLSAHALLAQALSLVQQSIDQKHQCVVLDLRATNDVVMADATRLQQIFWNLIKNASKFTPQGGVIRLKSANVLDSTTKREALSVQVEDSGIGIEKEFLSLIFTAFEQGKESITRLFGGLGLGLSIAASLATMHEGELTAASGGKDLGACFTLKLPTAIPATIASSDLDTLPVPVSNAASTEPLRVLLVEDNASTLLILSQALRRMGHIVETAATVTEAGAKAEASPPFDLLVSDLSMPDGSGLQLPAVLRKRQSHLLAIAITGNGSAEDRAQSEEAGFAIHLTKPIRLAELKNAISLHCNK